MTFTIDLTGQAALVTGAGQGVGRRISLALASAGATVVVNDYVAERAAAVAAEVVAAGGTAEAVAFDVSDYAAVAAAVGTLAGIDILVNNAGNAGPHGMTMVPFVETEPSEWDRYFAVNLYGPLYCTRAVLPGMIERGDGRVITIISDAARWGEARLVAYSAAKAGAGGFTRALAREVGRHGITVNNVSLGTIDPTGGAAERGELPPEVRERLDGQLRRYIVRRFGRPDDVAALVTFLASPLATWITGQTYAVNGGYTVNQ